MSSRCWMILALILILYVILSLNRLADFPPMSQDEPWIASAPYKLVTQGVYGSDLFTGYYGMDQHDFDHMPVYPLLQAAVFRLLGAGAFQMRLLPVSLGFVLLLLVVAAGYQLGNAWIGILAATLLIILRVGGDDGSTGILVLDLARINRYDIAVPVFGLMAFLAFNRAERDGFSRWYALTGLFVGLSTLSHLYGVFWLPVVLVVMICRRGRHLLKQPAPIWILAGFLAAVLPWLAYIATNWTDYLNQTRSMADRYDVFRPSFYVTNLMNEIDRYRPIGLFSGASGWVGRPGVWALLLGIPVALGVMLWQLRNHARDAGFTLAVAATVQPLLFALLLKAKTFAYLVALWPLGALALAWFAMWLWSRKNSGTIRAALALLLVLILTEGALRVANTWKLAQETTSYEEFTRKVSLCIPADSLVLGLQHYWLGLRNYPYRSWLVPSYLTRPLYNNPPLTMDEALERVRPDVVLIDRYMNQYFERIQNAGDTDHHLYEGFQNFMQRHSAELQCTVEDRTYGTMRVYVLKQTPSSTQ